MINFKEQDGMLFKMLEEPVPLTPDAEMPCLVRLIQDDSPMGKHNKGLHGFDPGRLTPKICTEVVDVNDLSDPNRGRVRYDGFISCQYYHYELIGIPVIKHSADWAWYQMISGEKVIYAEMNSQRFYAIKKGCDYCAFYESDWSEVHINTRRTYGEFIEYSKMCGILSWQIYKEPKPEPQYKVGDWVKYDIDSYLQVIEPSGKERTLCRTLSGVNVYPYTSCLTKASHADVVIHIGCLSGKVEDLSYAEDGRFWLIGKATERCSAGMYAILYEEMLDTETREIVESLLKAQMEEEWTLTR